MAGRPIRPRSPLIRPTRRSMSSRRMRYCSTRSRDGVATWTKTASSTSKLAVLDQLAERAQPRVDALGVVQPVDAEEDPARAAQGLADLRGPLDDSLGSRQLLERGGVDRDGEGRGSDRPAVGQVDQVAVGLVADPPPDEPDEVLRTARHLEADQVGPEQPFEDLAAPGQLLEELLRRERDVQVEADAQVRPELAQHLRDQLELVVVDPHGGALRGDLGGPVGEALVDREVGVPPLTVELRLGDHVVVDRPQGAVGEALVELLDLLGGQRHRHQLEAVVLERLELGLRPAGPADPDAVVGPHDRLQGADQAAGGAAPLGRAVGQRDLVHR